MCGIAGFLQRSSLYEPEASDIARRMADALAYRGPDDSGVWVDAEPGLAFGHRRLSIIDLSPAGHQPMHSASGRLVIVYNGEIYNYREIRAELDTSGVRCKGGSDTEVILEACERWGVEQATPRFIGMFAFALWDRRDRALFLVRDRLGIKPLYWGAFGGTVLFASELKAFKQHASFRPEIDRDALAAFFRHHYVPAPWSIYRGVRKLRPGTILKLTPGAAPEEHVYWSLADVIRAAQAARDPALGDNDAEERLDALLRDAIARRMIADVPLGAFLSGGIDSSTVVSLMQAQSSRPVRTFSIGFADAAYDEAAHAKSVAAHLGTDHTELYVDSACAQSVIPSLPEIYDEPFADASQVPTCLISELTRRQVTVALTGDGGDEVFGGYDRYAITANRWRRLSKMPRPVRRATAAALELARGARLKRLAAGMTGDFVEFYRHAVSHRSRPSELVIDAVESPSAFTDAAVAAAAPGDPLDCMRFLDAITYLPDDILTKVDRASMAVSLEARVPILDHRVVEFAWTLPARSLVRHGQSKWLLRRVLNRYVPLPLVDRPKMGFGIPLSSWLRGPLRSWAEDLLGEARMRREGYLEAQLIRREWAEYLSGAANRPDDIWVVLMFQAWLAHQRQSMTSTRVPTAAYQ